MSQRGYFYIQDITTYHDKYDKTYPRMFIMLEKHLTNLHALCVLAPSSAHNPHSKSDMPFCTKITYISKQKFMTFETHADNGDKRCLICDLRHEYDETINETVHKIQEFICSHAPHIKFEIMKLEDTYIV